MTLKPKTISLLCKMAELNLDQLKTKLAEAKSVLVLLPPQPEADLVTSARALGSAFKLSGRTVTVGCSSPIPEAEEIKTTVGKQNLIISFPYREENVEHVSYDIDEATNKFNLIIRPKEGKSPLDINSVEFNHTGASADLVITLGITSLEELGKLYSDEKRFLDNAEIINLKKGGPPAEFAAMDLSAVRSTCLSELTVWLLRQAGLKPQADLAGNLYRQLMTSTNSFQSPLVSAETFEAAAFLLRSGARTMATPAMPPAMSVPNFAPAPFFPPAPQLSKANPLLEEPLVEDSQTEKKTAPGAIPADWQGPKIFRAGEMG